MVLYGANVIYLLVNFVIVKIVRKGVVDIMKLMNYSLEYLIESNTPAPPKQPYTACQYRILCEVIRRKKVTKEYFYTLIGRAYHCRSVEELDYGQMYRVIWILNHWDSSCLFAIGRV